MNTYFLIAAILCFLLGLVHSVLGEYLIFKEKRIKGRFVPSKTCVELKERHLRILWATWHLTSLFGWCIGAFLTKVSLQKPSLNSDLIDFIITSTSYTMLAAALLVLIATKGKHPGWVILLLIAALLIAGS